MINSLDKKLLTILMFSLFVLSGCEEAQFSRGVFCETTSGLNGQCRLSANDERPIWIGGVVEYTDDGITGKNRFGCSGENRCFVAPGSDMPNVIDPVEWFEGSGNTIEQYIQDNGIFYRFFGCGNGVCEVNDGETGDYCPEDCMGAPDCYITGGSCESGDNAIFWFSFNNASESYLGELINGHISPTSVGEEFTHSLCCGIEAPDTNTYSLEKDPNDRPGSSHFILWGTEDEGKHITDTVAANDQDFYLKSDPFVGDFQINCAWVDQAGEGETVCQENGYDSCLFTTNSLAGDGHMAPCLDEDPSYGNLWEDAYLGYDNKYCCTASCESCDFGTPIDDEIVGDDCITNADCDSGYYCQDGECNACLPLASSCSNSFECCSGTCFGGTCRGSNPPWILDKKAKPPSPR